MKVLSSPWFMATTATAFLLIVSSSLSSLFFIDAFSPICINTRSSFIKARSTNNSSNNSNKKCELFSNKSRSRMNTQLFYTDNDDSNNNNNNNRNNNSGNNNPKQIQTNQSLFRRTSIKGISVSPLGFLILLQTSSSSSSSSQKIITLPILLTPPTQGDIVATTSPESLTICQLLSGVDMAGVILSPDVLKHLVGLYCSPSTSSSSITDENNNDNCIMIEDELGLEMIIPKNTDHEEEEECEDDEKDFSTSRSSSTTVKQFVHDFIQTSLLQFDINTQSFEEATMYQRNRVVFPSISLDSIKIDIPTDITTGMTMTTQSWTDMIMHQVQEANNNRETSNSSSSSTHSKSSENTTYYGTGSRVGSVSSGSMNQNHHLVPIPLQFTLECRIDGDKTLDIPLYNELHTIMNAMKTTTTTTTTNENAEHDLENIRNNMEQVLYTYNDQCSGSFLSIALALRYKCPIVITSRALDAIESIQTTLNNQPTNDVQTETTSTSICIFSTINHENKNNNDENIKMILPQWKSASDLHSQSKRVVENIEQGFQLTKLQGALRIALSRGDDMAADKIRAAIDKLLGDQE